ncbi:MAG: hypothetical protein LBU65_01825 [Planctomycetaceae bacterium]|jgi:IS1 family transposase|nr:hypothetical protein [Planctomycetaceae bacterium]
MQLCQPSHRYSLIRTNRNSLPFQLRHQSLALFPPEHGNLDKLLELLSPLEIGKVYSDGNYAYYERFDSDTLVVSKKNTQNIERKHLSLRAWCSRLVRKGIRFPKTE